MEAGIDDIAFFIPRPYVDYRDFAAARGISPEKLEKGIGVKQMAMPDSDEDAATMAATACLRLIQKNNLSPEDIGVIDAATECGLDASKQLSTYVVGMLEQVYGKGAFGYCTGDEFKSACAAGSKALLDNWGWILAGENNRKALIVIASDIAKYDMAEPDKESPAECTQGAGAAALLVRGNPRIMALERRVASGTIRDDSDFFRPFWRDTPELDGPYSVDCYLEQVAKAFKRYKQRALENGLIKAGRDFTSAIDYFAFHLPFPKMGKWALERILAEEYVDEITQIAGRFGPLLTNEWDMLGDKSKLREILKLKKSGEVFKQKVEPSVAGCAHVGNIYTGSVFLSLASILDAEHFRKKDIAGKRVVFLSYGSGSSAKVYSGIISREYADAIGRGIVAPALENRQRLSMQQYEALHRKEIKEPVAKKSNQFVLSKIGEDGRRHYGYIE